MPDMPALAADDAAHGPVPGQGHVRALPPAPPRLSGPEPWELPGVEVVGPLVLRIAELEELLASCECGAAARSCAGPRFAADRALDAGEVAEIRAVVRGVQAWHGSVRLAGEQLAGAVLPDPLGIDGPEAAGRA